MVNNASSLGVCSLGVGTVSSLGVDIESDEPEPINILAAELWPRGLSSGGGWCQVVTTNAPIHNRYVVTKEQTAKRTWEGIGEKRHAAMAKPRMSPRKCTPKMSQRSSNKVEDPKPACQAEGSGTSEKKFAKGDASTSGDFFLWLVSSFHCRTIRAVSPLQELSCRCHGLSQNVPSPVQSVPYDRLPNRKHNLPPARFVSIRSSNASQLISNDRTHHHQGNLV